jgi:hypothetical protein
MIGRRERTASTLAMKICAIKLQNSWLEGYGESYSWHGISKY